MRRLLPLMLILFAASGCKDETGPTESGIQETSWRQFSTMKEWLAYLESEYCIYSSGRPGCTDCYDSQADDPEKFPIIMTIYDEVAAEMEDIDRLEQTEFCKQFWAEMKKQLKDQGIDWKTPCEMNPDMKLE